MRPALALLAVVGLLEGLPRVLFWALVRVGRRMNGALEVE